MTQEFYALGIDRSARAVRSFLDHFLPERTPTCNDYPVPEFSDIPRSILKTESEILEHMERHASEPYGLYWNGVGASSNQAMVFYTTDCQVIFGLAEAAPESAVRLKELADFVGAKYSMLGSEQRPPDTAVEFIALCSTGR